MAVIDDVRAALTRIRRGANQSDVVELVPEPEPKPEPEPEAEPALRVATFTDPALKEVEGSNTTKGSRKRGKAKASDPDDA